MILALPYLPAVTDYRQLAVDLRKRGPLAHHSLRIISRADDADAAFDLGEELSDMFDKVSTHGVNTPDDANNTAVANMFFFAAMTFLQAQKTEPGEPDSAIMLYMDPLYRPSRNGWLKEIQSGYFFAGAPPVFGMPAVMPDGQTRIFKGPVVFSRAFPLRSALINYLSGEAHWRVYLRSEMFVSYADTNLIGLGSEAVLKPLPVKKS